MRFAAALALSVLCSAGAVQAQERPSVLFIGNSFTFGSGSAVRFYRSGTVTDLNDEGIGGVPALFKSFADQSDLEYDVYLETRGGSGFEFHFENKLDVIGNRSWDMVVMQGQSTLDLQNPGDPTKYLATAPQLAQVFVGRNPDVELYLMATWSRADLTYPSEGAWYGKPIAQMARDVRAGIDQAAQITPGVKAVLPVGEAWTRAMETGVADPNPYDGIAPDQVDLWTNDHYHASSYGYYLEALVVFGTITGLDPRSLGGRECSGMELGFSRTQVSALQQVAFDELASTNAVTAAPAVESGRGGGARCAVG
jgi:hypothetical protein